MKRLVGLVIVVCLVVVGCAAPITSGKVVNKSYIPGYYYTYRQPIYSTSCRYTTTTVNGRPRTSRICRSILVGYTNVPEWSPPSWKLEIKNSKQLGWVNVTSGVYNSIKIGQHWKAAQ